MISDQERDLLRQVGFAPEEQRAGTSVLADRQLRLAASNDPDVVLMPLAEALTTYDFVQDLMFKLVSPGENEHIREASEQIDDPMGHFLWVRKGAKLRLPVQNFTIFETPQARQFTHDVTLIDEGAEVVIYSGTAVPPRLNAGRHISVSETHLRKGASCTTVAVEQWGNSMEVFSYGYAHQAEGSRSSSTSIAVGAVGRHTSVGRTTLDAGATETIRSVVFAPEGTERFSDSETILAGPEARSEQVSRMVSAGGTIEMRATLVGDADGSYGFLGCDGLKLGDSGVIYSVPALRARVEGSQLSHEASVGRLSTEKLSYLMASGMDEEEARALLIRGFLQLHDTRLPTAVRERVESMIAAAKSGGM